MLESKKPAAHHAALRLVVDNTRSSAVSLMPRSDASCSIGKWSRYGTRPRCRHLSIASSEAPNAAPSARIVSKSVPAMPHHGDKLSTMSTGEDGPSTCPLDLAYVLGQLAMLPNLSDRQFRAILGARVKRYRERAGYTQEQMAHMLGLASKDPYVKYEGRSALPHKLMYTFCLIVKVDMEDLLTHKLDQDDLQALAALEQKDQQRKAS